MTHLRLYTTFALMIGLTLALTDMTHAQSSRLYFAGYLGLSTYPSIDFDDNDFNVQGEFEPDNTPTFAGALGLRLTRNFRMEAELSYRDASFDDLDVSGVANPVDVTGELKSTIFLLNAYYDFDIRNWRTQPYIGGGIGLAYHSGEITDPSNTTNSVADEQLGLAWNLGGGMKYRVSPRLAWTGGYRYLDSLDFEFENTDVDFSSHEFRIGLEYDLGY